MPASVTTATATATETRAATGRRAPRARPSVLLLLTWQNALPMVKAIRPVLALLTLSLLSASCSESKEDESAEKKGGKDELPKKFEPFTVETLKKTEGLVEVGEPLKSERRKLDARLGKSIYADRLTQWWAVAEGESCWAVTTTLKVDDGTVESVTPPTELTAEDGQRYEHCVAASGRNKCFRDGADPGECHDKFPQAE